MNVTSDILDRITYRKIEITPELASEWLETRNTHNRRKKVARIKELVSDIKSGEWTVTADHIAFDTNGTLQNGQNRLSAIAEAGIPVWAVVACGMPPRSFDVTDTGSKRTLGDVLGVKGYEHAKDLAALLPAIYVWNTQGRAIGSGGTRSMLTNSAALKMLDELNVEHLYWCIDQAHRVYRVSAGSPTAWALALWIFDNIDHDDAVGFIDRMIDINSGAPFALLRHKFLTDRTGGDGVLGYRKDLALAYIIKTWNAYRTGEEMRILRYRVGGSNPEQYPRPNTRND